MYHIIRRQKHLRKVLVGEVEEQLKELIWLLAKEQDGEEIIELKVMLDQAHLLCAVDPQFGAQKAV